MAVPGRRVAAGLAAVLAVVLLLQDPLGLKPQASAVRGAVAPNSATRRRLLKLLESEMRAAASGDYVLALRLKAEQTAIQAATGIELPPPRQPGRRQPAPTPRPRPARAPDTAAAAAPAEGCGPGAYHMLLTAQGSVYQMWQSRMMYFHYMKQKARDSCRVMGEFTRLVACKPETIPKWKDEVPSFYVEQLSDDDTKKFKGYGVINRPYSVLQWLQHAEGMAAVREDYIFIAETDHLFMRPMPNLATPNTPVAYKFGYMGPNPGHMSFMKRVWPGADYKAVQPGGPSPIIMHKRQVREITQTWYETARGLKMDPEADKALGWVIEMWGYVISAARLGIVHKMLPKLQIEPGAASKVPAGFVDEYYIYHFTYGMEYMLDGRPCPAHTIGEWSLDKRHYGGSYPPRDLQPPPDAASPAAKWLHRAWNEASAGVPGWPETKAMGTHGWRRNKLTPADLERSRLARALVGTQWMWTSHDKVSFAATGEFVTPWSNGTWGVVNSPACPVASCVFGDFAGALHNFRFTLSAAGDPVLDTFESRRIGDEHLVTPTRRR
eukprot:TRINITY_DN10561_c0_g1_i2.p1 TRINITY_DN10561_c0_g1~~TRINITY_DN10561_c0_g1_i2.p1  ORF type:complete len:551 (+),score=188.13 TRINITY_DN10561_c0_g1_i2:56-1708(+)